MNEIRADVFDREKIENIEQLKLNAISDAYGLPELKFLREPEKGISTKNIIVSGGDDIAYFIKQHKKKDLSRIENAEKSANYISENSDVPVVFPIMNKKGQLHTVIDDQALSVFFYVPHTEYHPNSESERIVFTKNLGEMLGKIHSVSQAAASIPGNINPISAWVLDDRMESIDKYKKISELIVNKDSLDEYDKKALAFIELKTNLLKDNNFIKRNNQPIAVCHGDYHGGNLLFNDQGLIKGVCDWDMSGIGNPYSEFIRSFNMCVIRRDFEHIEDKKIVAEAFIEGYISKCGFEFDVSELEYAIESWYEKLLTSQWPLSDHYHLGHYKTDSSLDSEFDKVIFLRDGRKKLFEIIESCLK